jgi:DNA-directed RNA polymerase subunit N (RpoN/RPB10)
MAYVLHCRKCGSTISKKWLLFHEKKNDKDNSELLKELNITRDCCKTDIITSRADENYYDYIKYIKKHTP